MDQWQVLKKDHLPAYISWEQYLANLRRLAENASRFSSLGAVRQGEALLGGLVTCERCGLRMIVVYSDARNAGRYVCRTRHGITGLACQSVQANMVDRLVTNQVLQAIQPAVSWSGEFAYLNWVAGSPSRPTQMDNTNSLDGDTGVGLLPRSANRRSD